ncbi:MAG: DUF4406 domain-containing protein [Bacteroidaceae bacterium]|nr:DUF4406 domain-containing protein [Bacteroidaceae bacterium]
MKTYISLPISGRSIEEAKAEADSAKKVFMQTFPQSEVITPFEIHPELPDMPPHEQYAYCMGRDIEVLLTCDQIVMCPGWRNSKGCQAEHAIAEVYGLTISYMSSINTKSI